MSAAVWHAEALCSYIILLGRLPVGAATMDNCPAAFSILDWLYNLLTFPCLSGPEAFCGAIYTLIISAGSNRGWVLYCTDIAKAFPSLKELLIKTDNT